MQALVVDSNADDCAILVEYLTQAGYEAVTVASTRQARDALDSQVFDLLILEVKLPDGNGLQLCNDIRERLGDGMVIIFVAERTTSAHRVVSIELGADDFLDKPCNAAELLSRIEARMRRRNMQKVNQGC